jgi:hypothetical protein
MRFSSLNYISGEFYEGIFNLIIAYGGDDNGDEKIEFFWREPFGEMKITDRVFIYREAFFVRWSGPHHKYQIGPIKKMSEKRTRSPSPPGFTCDLKNMTLDLNIV